VDAPPELAARMRRICRGALRDGLLPHGFKLGRPNTWTEVWPFLAAGIPGINVSTFTDAFDRTEYHTQFDTTEGVDFDYLAKLTEVCARMLLESTGWISPPERASSGDRAATADVEASARAVGSRPSAAAYSLDAIDAPRYPRADRRRHRAARGSARRPAQGGRAPVSGRDQLALLGPVSRGVPDRTGAPRTHCAPGLLGRSG
jgi:hypothetical protein